MLLILNHKLNYQPQKSEDCHVGLHNVEILVVLIVIIHDNESSYLW